VYPDRKSPEIPYWPYCQPLGTSEENCSDDNFKLIEKTKNKYANTQKQQFGSPSLQASLRFQTLAFLPPHLLRG